MTGSDEEWPPPPRANADLIGHEEAERRLAGAWRSGRMPHGWLIAGPPGIGKATLAYRLARYVFRGGVAPSGFLDEGGGGEDSLYVDPSDPVFHRVASGGHADLVTLEREIDERSRRLKSAIAVDAVRAASTFLTLTAAEGGWRIVIVDSADELNVNGANALLKKLEEPPSKSLIILISHSPAGLPATIRSRCCMLTLGRLDDERVQELLLRYRPETEPGEARMLARLSDGSIGRALRLADAGGAALHEAIAALLATLPRPDVEALHALADRLARRDAEPAYRTAAELLQWWVWRAVTARTGRAGGAEEGNGGELHDYERACLERLSAFGGLDQWLEVWEKITRLFGQAERINLDRKQVMLSAFHQIARMSAS